MGQPGDVEVKLVIRDRQIVSVEPIGDAEVTPVTDPPDLKDLRRCPYGLRPVETIYEVQWVQSAPKCYMIIGGFKVQVPCS
jgi:hypothetical protein